jgi:hypothetical protein
MAESLTFYNKIIVDIGAWPWYNGVIRKERHRAFQETLI